MFSPSSRSLDPSVLKPICSTNLWNLIPQTSQCFWFPLSPTGLTVHLVLVFSLYFYFVTDCTCRTEQHVELPLPYRIVVLTAPIYDRPWYYCGTSALQCIVTGWTRWACLLTSVICTVTSPTDWSSSSCMTSYGRGALTGSASLPSSTDSEWCSRRLVR